MFALFDISPYKCIVFLHFLTKNYALGIHYFGVDVSLQAGEFEEHSMAGGLSFVELRRLIGIKVPCEWDDFDEVKAPEEAVELPFKALSDEILGKIAQFESLIFELMPKFPGVNGVHPYDFLMDLSRVIAEQYLYPELTASQRAVFPTLLHWYFEAYMNEDNDERRAVKQYLESIRWVGIKKGNEQAKEWLHFVFHMLSSVDYCHGSSSYIFSTTVRDEVVKVCRDGWVFSEKLQDDERDIGEKLEQVTAILTKKKVAARVSQQSKDANPVEEPPSLPPWPVVKKEAPTQISLTKIEALKRILEFSQVFYFYHEKGDELHEKSWLGFAEKLSQINMAGHSLYDHIIKLVTSDGVEQTCRDILLLLNSMDSDQLDELNHQFYTFDRLRINLAKSYPETLPVHQEPLQAALVTISKRCDQGTVLKPYFTKMAQDANRLQEHTTPRHFVFSREKLQRGEVQKSQCVSRMLVSLVSSAQTLFEKDPFDYAAYEKVFKQFTPEEEKKLASHTDWWGDYAKKIKNLVLTCLTFGHYARKHHRDEGRYFPGPRSQTYENVSSLKGCIQTFWQQEPKVHVQKAPAPRQGVRHEVLGRGLV